MALGSSEWIICKGVSKVGVPHVGLERERKDIDERRLRKGGLKDRQVKVKRQNECEEESVCM